MCDFGEDTATVEEMFSDMEKAVPIGARCMNCVHRHNATSSGANIFCLCPQDGMECIIVTDRNAKDCKYFKQKTEETDEELKRAIKMLIEEGV